MDLTNQVNLTQIYKLFRDRTWVVLVRSVQVLKGSVLRTIFVCAELMILGNLFVTIRKLAMDEGRKRKWIFCNFHLDLR